MPITSTHPQDIELADRVQLGLIGLGDGFFPLKGNVTISSVTRPITSWMAEVLPGTGLQVLIRDYVAMIQGIILTDKNKNDLDFTVTEPLTIPSVGTWYITLRANTFTGYDGLDRPDSDKGVFAAEATVPATGSGKILVAKVVVPPSTTQISSSMIINSQKFLYNEDDLANEIEALSANPSVPSSITSAIATLQSQVATLQTQVANNSLVATDQITASKLDNSSTVGVDMNGNFILPSFVPITYVSDNFPGPSFNSTWELNGPGGIVNNVGEYFDTNLGYDGWLLLKNYLPSNSFTASWNVNFTSPAGSSPSGFIGEIGFNLPNAVGAPDTQSGWPFANYRINMFAYWDSVTYNLTNIELDLYNHFETIQLGAVLAPGSLVGNPNVVSGVSIPMKATINNGQIQIFVNNTKVIDVTDPSWDSSSKGWFVMGDNGSVNPTRTSMIGISNVSIKSVVLGTYNSSGTLLTTQLNSVNPINKAAMGWNATLPTNTSAMFELSLNGGTNWVTVTNDEIIDGTVTPWNGMEQVMI